MFNKVTVMVGVPGSGKSTYVSKIRDENTIVLSSDAIRKEFSGEEADQTTNDKVFYALRRRLKEAVSATDSDIIIDATNITLKARKHILNTLKDFPCYKIAVVMTASEQECKERNASRSRVVPECVIGEMIGHYEIPFYEEGFDDIYFSDYSSADISFFEEYDIDDCPLLTQMSGFDQKNKHHKHTLERHCMLCYSYVKQQSEDIFDKVPLHRAAIIHDYGKLFTQSPNKKDPTQMSYLQHHSVGTFKLLSQLENLGLYREDQIANCLFYINYHMRPFLYESNPNMAAKDKSLFGEVKYNNLRLLHEADIKATGNV